MFTLIEQAQKIRATERIEDIYVYGASNMQANDQQQLINSFKDVASDDPVTVNFDADADAQEQLKKIFKG